MAKKLKNELASEKASQLDAATQDTLSAVRSKNKKAIIWFIISWTILFGLAVAGLFYQNRLATENKNHIDCIIKLSETPLKTGTRAKYITYLNNTCQIRFTH